MGSRGYLSDLREVIAAINQKIQESSKKEAKIERMQQTQSQFVSERLDH